MAAMQLTNVVALQATNINAAPLVTSPSSRVRLSSNNRLAMRPLVVRAASDDDSGTDKQGYAKTNAGGSGAQNPSSFANDIVEGVKNKVDDAKQSAGNLGSETQENLKNVGEEAKKSADDLAGDTKNIASKVSNSNPGH